MFVSLSLNRNGSVGKTMISTSAESMRTWSNSNRMTSSARRFFRVWTCEDMPGTSISNFER